MVHKLSLSLCNVPREFTKDSPHPNFFSSGENPCEFFKKHSFMVAYFIIVSTLAAIQIKIKIYPIDNAVYTRWIYRVSSTLSLRFDVVAYLARPTPAIYFIITGFSSNHRFGFHIHRLTLIELMSPLFALSRHTELSELENEKSSLLPNEVI